MSYNPVTPSLRRTYGLGEIKHKIIIISIVSRLASRCIMIPHADFVLTLAIIGMSKLLLYIRTQIKYYKTNLYLISYSYQLRSLHFLRNCSFVFGKLEIWSASVVRIIRKLYASIHTFQIS